MKPLYATQHEAALIASLPIGGSGMLCREVKFPVRHFTRIEMEPAWQWADDPDDPRYESEKLIPIFHDENGSCPVEDNLHISPFPLGTVLAVKEGFSADYNVRKVAYRADGEEIAFPWQSPVIMPPWAVRSYIRITGLRVARVQDVDRLLAYNLGYRSVSCARCAESGVEQSGEYKGHPCADCAGNQEQREDQVFRVAFGGKRWLDNPFVWLPTFEKVSKEAAHA